MVMENVPTDFNFLKLIPDLIDIENDLKEIMKKL